MTLKFVLKPDVLCGEYNYFHNLKLNEEPTHNAIMAQIQRLDHYKELEINFSFGKKFRQPPHNCRWQLFFY